MTKLFIQNLFEYLFDFLDKKPPSFLFNRLERDDYLKIKTTAKMKRFIENSPLEDKLLMCMNTGMRGAIVLWDAEKEGNKKVQDVLITYLDTPAHELPKELSKSKVFAAMDIDFIKSIQFVAKASNSNQYSINRKYLKVKENSKQFKSRLFSDKLEAENNLDWYVNTIQHAIGLEEIIETYGLTMDYLKILLYLYVCPNGATRENISKKINKQRGLFLLERMKQLTLIKNDPRIANVYIISPHGIMVLDKVVSNFPE